MNAIFQDISIPQKDFLLAMKAMGERRNIPNISWNTAEYLFSLFHGKNIKNVLEIGPANGFSTLILGVSCPEAKIVSIECSRHAFEELRENIKTFCQMTTLPAGRQDEKWIMKNGMSQPTPAELGPKVTSDINQELIWNHQLYYADARELLSAFIEGASKVLCRNPKSELCDIQKLQFDFIFIDGAFRMTRDFFDLSFPLLQSGWTIIIDDAIKYAWKMDGFQEYLESINIPYKLIQTDADDGIMLIEMK